MQGQAPDRPRLRARVQAVTFLVIHQKHKKSLEEITNDLCPVLSVQQLYRISTMYWDDRYNTETVSHEVRLFWTHSSQASVGLFELMDCLSRIVLVYWSDCYSTGILSHEVRLCGCVPGKQASLRHLDACALPVTTMLCK